MLKRMVSCPLLLSAKITAMPTIAAVYIAKDWTQHFMHSRQVLYWLSSILTLKSCVMYFTLIHPYPLHWFPHWAVSQLQLQPYNCTMKPSLLDIILLLPDQISKSPKSDSAGASEYVSGPLVNFPSLGQVWNETHCLPYAVHMCCIVETPVVIFTDILPVQIPIEDWRWCQRHRCQNTTEDANTMLPAIIKASTNLWGLQRRQMSSCFVQN